MATERPYDPTLLVAKLAPETLRSIARRLEVDPAMLCRPWSERQADRYATLAGLHPGEVWGDLYWHGATLDDLDAILRSPPWLQRSTARLAGLDGTGRALRRACQLSVSDAARAIGVRPARLRAWEAGTQPPNGDVVDRYAAFLADCARWVTEHAARIGLQALVQIRVNDPCNDANHAPSST